jgi:hypothetical protein
MPPDQPPERVWVLWVQFDTSLRLTGPFWDAAEADCAYQAESERNPSAWIVLKCNGIVVKTNETPPPFAEGAARPSRRQGERRQPTKVS